MREFTLPSLGADMDEGTLLEWRIKPGDAVKRGQVVAVVDTTKAAIDVECWDEGTVDSLIVEPGTAIPVGTVLALLREPGETPEQAAQWKREHPPAAATRPAAPPTVPVAPAIAAAPPVPARTAEKPADTGARQRRVSPAARRRAETLGVPLDAVSGTGPGGAVTLEDVERAAAAPSAATPAETATPAQGAQIAKTRAAEMRRTIAAAMARSKREIPHYYLAAEIPLANAAGWLATENLKRPVADRLLMAVLFIKAVAKALEKFPELNGSHRDGRFEPSPGIHVGVAVSLRQGGLLAPAILDTNTKPLDQLMKELTDLVARTRAFSLRSSELSMPTVTVTNLGDQGVESVFGVIYPPQVAIIGFGKVTERVAAEGGAVRVVPAVTATLAADHRTSDGHRGALFLNELKARLQDPAAL